MDYAALWLQPSESRYGTGVIILGTGWQRCENENSCKYAD